MQRIPRWADVVLVPIISLLLAAICAAGAARYGRWDVVDRIVEGAFDAAMHFAGRPPELFSGISRDDAPMPVAYPASCAPQACAPPCCWPWPSPHLSAPTS